MINNRPHIIEEGNLIYELGVLKDNELIYDFDKMLIYIEAKGKQQLGKGFKLFEEDHDILFKLCNYIIRDQVNCKQLNIDLNKGILLTGPVGCGKTSLMKLLRHVVPHQKPYKVIPTRNIVFDFNHAGYKIIEDYGNMNYFCFDDLGVEPTGRHYGKDCNVMGEIILSRYDLFLKTKIKTHATTNLNAQELEDRYGNRVRSRMRQMFNLVGYDKSSIDKRK